MSQRNSGFCNDCGEPLIQGSDEPKANFIRRQCCPNDICRSRKRGRSAGTVRAGGGRGWSGYKEGTRIELVPLPWAVGEIVFEDAITTDGGFNGNRLVAASNQVNSSMSCALAWWQNDVDAGR